MTLSVQLTVELRFIPFKVKLSAVRLLETYRVQATEIQLT